MSSERGGPELLTQLLPTVKRILQLVKEVSYDRMAPGSHTAMHCSHTATHCSHTGGGKSQYEHWSHAGGSNTRVQHCSAPSHLYPQCFHLQVPRDARAKQPLQESLSAPLWSPARSPVRSHRGQGRPLPLIPQEGRLRQRNKSKSFKQAESDYQQQERNTMWEKQLVRRKTVAAFSTRKAECEKNHIYEEIDKLCDEHEEQDTSFLSLISSERRRNLQFYGCTGWDFGPDM